MNKLASALIAAAFAFTPLAALADSDMVSNVCKGDSTGYCHYSYIAGESNSDVTDHTFTIHVKGPNPVTSIRVDRKTSDDSYSWGGNFLEPPCGSQACNSVPVGEDFKIYFGYEDQPGVRHFGDCMQYIQVKFGNGQSHYDVIYMDTCKHSGVDVAR